MSNKLPECAYKIKYERHIHLKQNEKTTKEYCQIFILEMWKNKKNQFFFVCECEVKHAIMMC